MPGTTTYKVIFRAYPQNDYPGHPINEFARRPRMQHCPSSVPFTGSSSYGNQFVNWGPNALPPVNRPSTCPHSLPFKGTSSYASNFQPIDLSTRAKPLSPPATLVPDNKFTGVSSNMLDYKPFKIVPTGNPVGKKEPTPTFSFPGQYKTTAQNEFSRRPRKVPCPCDSLETPPDFMKTITYFNPTTHQYYV
eukprot:TRINITY_DN2807_c0_g1_i7.p2 TRINITY_DN2807_c0_g1~~TRINITY_DN2807_c0_g1_i7.p2  ORF type:complete len:191 (+),score=4.40 TRINITY_DN2807_c0_g1_i7:364-936(+)